MRDLAMRETPENFDARVDANLDMKLEGWPATAAIGMVCIVVAYAIKKWSEI